jgi:signal transduction histidine kinase/PAS domain-containing protein
MNIRPSPTFSSHEPAPPPDPTMEEASDQVSSPGRPSTRPWPGALRWIQQSTFAPEWLPEPLRHPLIGYLAALLIEASAMSLILVLHSLSPSFSFQWILVVLGVVVVALNWGEGPGLFATLAGALLFYLVVLPLNYSWAVDDLPDAIGLILYLVVGISVSLLAGGSERARQKAEATTRRLAQVEAHSRFDAQRLRTVLDVLPSAVMIADHDGQLLAMNPATTSLWGGDLVPGTDMTRYSSHNQFQAWWARTGQPLSPEEWPLVRTLHSGEAVLNEELEIETVDGQRRIILNSSAPIRDETGAVISAVISAQDVSELRRLEREAAERAQELEAIFDTITDGITVLDATGSVVRTNQAFRRLSGADRHPEYLALSADQRLPALAMRDSQGEPLAVDDWPATRLLRGETLTGVDVMVATLDGRDIVINVGGAPIRGQLGRVSGCVGVFRDVTARYQLEQHTRETLGALVAMAEAMVQVRPTIPGVDKEDGAATNTVVADAVLPLVARRLGQLTHSVLRCRHVSIVAVDPPTGQLDPVTQVGLPPDQAQAWWTSWSSPQRLEDRYSEPVAAALHAGEPALLDTHHLPECFWYTLFGAETGRIVPMQLGSELVGVLLIDYRDPDHDYSSQEEILLTGALAQLGALVLERDRLLRGWAEARANELALYETKAQMDTFLGIASHELKTPLTSLKLSLQISERRLNKLARSKTGLPAASEKDMMLQSAVDQLSRTAHQMERLERLVNDLVDVSRIQAGRLELRLHHADLAAIIQEAILDQQQAAPDRTIHLRILADVPLPVYADAGRIEQVVTNYLTNALKYSPADRPVEVGVTVEAGQQARVWVRDHGPGLPQEEQDLIWERFHRVKGVEVQSGAGVGLGLGLHISRMIVERHQGQVGVESAPGEGSTFWFTLPLNNRATAS